MKRDQFPGYSSPHINYRPTELFTVPDRYITPIKCQKKVGTISL